MFPNMLDLMPGEALLLLITYTPTMDGTPNGRISMESNDPKRENGRPGRSQHNALDALSVAITSKKVNWILDADIEGFFDAIDHEWLIRFLERRIGDPRILRLIRKWLRAGVSEDGEWSQTTVGTPQGAVGFALRCERRNRAPLLANVYLHYVFDMWIQWWRKSCRGNVVMVRYADDFVIGFENHSEATACLEALHTRFAQFGLKLHKDKTRLIEFGKYAIERRERHSESRPETFPTLLRPTQERSRLTSFVKYGSVRGAAGNSHPYRDNQ